ncbi:MAG: hypothetical protein ABFD90_11560 [Phycisphaerales bacterium]
MCASGSSLRSFAILLSVAGVLLIAACPVGAIPTVEFTDQVGDHPLVVTHEIPALEDFPPDMLMLLTLFGSLPESNPQIETNVGQAQVTALLLNLVGVEGQHFAKVVDGEGTARGVVFVQAYGPAFMAGFWSDSDSRFEQNLWTLEEYFGSVPTTVADGTMQEVLTYPGLILSVRFPSDELPSVPVPGSVLLVGCGLLCLRRRRHGSTVR